MAMTINTNVISINAQRNLNVSGNSLGTTMQRLSSGLRVNSAKDDAAGLAIAERMHAQNKGLAVAARNANDGISLAQTAEGALGKVGDMLQRARELAVQSSNATNSADDRKALQAEVSQLMAEVDRVAKTTSFNGKKLLDGEFTGAMFQVGASAGDNITVGALKNTKIAELSNVTYGSSKSDEVQTAAITEFGTEIKAGTLKIRVGASEAVDLGAIAAASSGEERIGQVVAAINAKTVDTGVTAFLEEGANGSKVLQLRSASGDAVSMEGFSQTTTGFGVASGTFLKNGTGASANLKTNYDALVTTGGATTGTAKWASATGAELFALGFLSKNAGDAEAAWNASGAGTTLLNNFAGSLTNADAKVAANEAINAFKEVVLKNYTTASAAASTYSHTADQAKAINAAVADLTAGLNKAAGIETAQKVSQVYDDLSSLMKLSDSEFITATGSLTGTTSAMGKLNTSFQAVNGAAFTATSVPKLDVSATAEQVQAARNSLIAMVDKHMSNGLGIDTTETKVQKGLDTMSIETQAGAWEAIQKLDSAINQVNAARGDLGALQTRFEKTVENIDIMSENISAARGRIVDADFATETANLSRSQILQQAGTAMVAQANQLPQNVLSLLR